MLHRINKILPKLSERGGENNKVSSLRPHGQLVPVRTDEERKKKEFQKPPQFSQTELSGYGWVASPKNLIIQINAHS